VIASCRGLTPNYEKLGSLPSTSISASPSPHEVMPRICGVCRVWGALCGCANLQLAAARALCLPCSCRARPWTGPEHGSGAARPAACRAPGRTAKSTAHPTLGKL